MFWPSRLSLQNADRLPLLGSGGRSAFWKVLERESCHDESVFTAEHFGTRH